MIPGVAQCVREAEEMRKREEEEKRVCEEKEWVAKENAKQVVR